MRSKNPTRNTLAAVFGAALLMGAGAAGAADLPEPQVDNGITFVTGGVDLDTAHAFEAASKHWPVTLEFAVKDRPVNSFLADVQVEIQDPLGRAILSTVSEGPFMLARLVPGNYRVIATFGGKSIATSLHVRADQPTKEVFMWPHAYLHAEG